MSADSCAASRWFLQFPWGSAAIHAAAPTAFRLDQEEKCRFPGQWKRPTLSGLRALPGQSDAAVQTGGEGTEILRGRIVTISQIFNRCIQHPFRFAGFTGEKVCDRPCVRELETQTPVHQSKYSREFLPFPDKGDAILLDSVGEVVRRLIESLEVVEKPGNIAASRCDASERRADRGRYIGVKRSVAALGHHSLDLLVAQSDDRVDLQRLHRSQEGAIQAQPPKHLRGQRDGEDRPGTFLETKTSERFFQLQDHPPLEHSGADRH